MKHGKGRGRKNKANSSGLTRRDLRRFLGIGAAALGVALLVFLAVFLTRPKLLWYVDESYSAAWNRILYEKAPPTLRYEVIARQGDAPFPKGRFGFVVSGSGPGGERVEGAPVAMYRDLSRSREYDGWMVLALDPWMVFRKHQDPEPMRSFLNLENERGSILLAGSDQGAIQAWLCQLLQESPGVFVPGGELWEEKSQALVREYPFQNGAFTYSWIQIWPLLFRSSGVSSVYAPLSQIRALPPFRSGVLDATRFPDPEEWNRYGLQADILWAKMHGDERHMKKLAATEKWLKEPRIQTVIANTLDWIPAHPSGVPYNTVSWETQMAWLRSSFIWQGVNNAQDS
ncbi:MAG: hypothetical protein LBI06_04320 [Treponema sp.]|jgi:hypothetical protein|nr:hypothetical protein [Treponema sp.]